MNKIKCPICNQLKEEVDFVIVNKRHICWDCDYNKQEYEEDRWQELAKKFIEKKRDDWERFVADEFSRHMADYEPPDHREDR